MRNDITMTTLGERYRALGDAVIAGKASYEVSFFFDENNRPRMVAPNDALKEFLVAAFTIAQGCLPDARSPSGLRH